MAVHAIPLGDIHGVPTGPLTPRARDRRLDPWRHSQIQSVLTQFNRSGCNINNAA